MFGEEIRDFRDKTQRTSQRSVPASFSTLCHDYIGTNVDRIRDVIHVLTLANQDCAGSTNSIYKGTRITEG